MLLFIITLVLTFVFLVVAVFAEDFCNDIADVVGGISTVFFIIGLLATITMIISIIFANVGSEGEIASNQQRYESLVYQLENDLYDNDNDLGKKELYDEIRDWNEDLARGKAMQHDIWVGWFYPNIYDNFEFIELG